MKKESVVFEEKFQHGFLSKKVEKIKSFRKSLIEFISMADNKLGNFLKDNGVEFFIEGESTIICESNNLKSYIELKRNIMYIHWILSEILGIDTVLKLKCKNKEIVYSKNNLNMKQEVSTFYYEDYVSRMSKIKIGICPYPFIVANCIPYKLGRKNIIDSVKCLSFDGEIIMKVEKGKNIVDEDFFKERIIPSGGLSRYFLLKVFTMSKLTKSRYVFMGKNYRETCKLLGISGDGGGGYAQMKKIFYNTSFSNFKIINKSRPEMNIFSIILPWESNAELISGLKGAYIVIEEEFYENYIRKHAAPFYLDSYSGLRKSPMSMDIYIWITFRMNHLKKGKTLKIPWDELKKQFGGNYSNKNGIYDFKREFINIIENKISFFWPEVKKAFDFNESGSYCVVNSIEPHVRQIKE